jgi:hypothetical protein
MGLEIGDARGGQRETALAERERERESEKKTIGGHGKDEKKKEENLPSSFRLLYLKRERNEKVQKT